MLIGPLKVTARSCRLEFDTIVGLARPEAFEMAVSDVITGWLMRLHLPTMRCSSLHPHMRNIFNSCCTCELPLLKDRIETRHISAGEPQ